MTTNDSGYAEEMFSCSMCSGSGRIVRGNGGINIRCPDCQQDPRPSGQTVYESDLVVRRPGQVFWPL